MNSWAHDKTIAVILRYDSKVTSYKIALLRAINDIILEFPDIAYRHAVTLPEEAPEPFDVAVPLRMLAELWVAYYWPFMDENRPIYQGPRAERNGVIRNDVDFRPPLTQLRQAWEGIIQSPAKAADGFFLVTELRTPRRRQGYPQSFCSLFELAVRTISRTLLMPIRYAGPDNWTVFERPRRWSELSLRMGPGIVAVPGTEAQDVCLVIKGPLWESFRALSLWIEALCIHEWCLFTENVKQQTSLFEGGESKQINRGDVYYLLTSRPDNRRPLTWERNQVEILMMEGTSFVCPWTRTVLTQKSQFDLDHLLPLSLYPINELWNLLPVESRFNQHTKRDRVPSWQRLSAAEPHLAQSYRHYESSRVLRAAVHEDASLRFAGLQSNQERDTFAAELARRAVLFIDEVARARSVTRF